VRSTAVNPRWCGVSLIAIQNLLIECVEDMEAGHGIHALDPAGRWACPSSERRTSSLLRERASAMIRAMP
jgi:hypothetical protein